MQGSTQGRYSVRAVRRALDILFSFSRLGPSLSNTEISNHLGLDPSTVFRLLACLQEAGLVTFNPEGRKYELGPAVAELHDAWSRHFNLRALARPFLQRLWEETNETVGLSVLAGRSRVYVDSIESAHLVRAGAELGQLLPLHAAAPGRVFLAHADESLRREVLSGPLPQLGPRTVTDPGRIEADLADISSRGYAVSIEERSPDAASVAAPIFGPGNRLVAVLVVVVPTHRFTVKRKAFVIERILAAAGDISRAVGGPPSLSHPSVKLEPEGADVTVKRVT